MKKLNKKVRAELEALCTKQAVGQAKKVLIFDIETSPMEFWAWRPGKQYLAPHQILKDWTILSWSAKWLGSKDIFRDATWLHGDDPRDDKETCRSLHKLMDEADILIAHNGKSFDVRKVNTRFLCHGFGPPKPYKVVDTLMIARGNFGFSSNKLDELGKKLGIGSKVSHSGYELWFDCLAGDAKAQELMLEYNIGDVVLLELIYLALRPWDKRHPNINLDFEVKRCSVCSCDKFRERGELYTPVSSYAAYQCTKCGHWMRGSGNLKTKEEMANTTRNAV